MEHGWRLEVKLASRVSEAAAANQRARAFQGNQIARDFRSRRCDASLKAVLSLPPPLARNDSDRSKSPLCVLLLSTSPIRKPYDSHHVRRHPLDNGPGPARYVNFNATDRDTPRLRHPCIAKPTAALVPFTRAAPVALIHSSSTKSATMERPGLVKGNPGTPPPMKKGMPTNVPLPSQEGKQGVMQYALYVL